MHQYLRQLLVATSVLLASPLYAAPVNVNTATAEKIAQALNGVGMQKARAIVDYRKANGPFKRAEDLTAIKGIGTKTVEKNRGDIQL